MSVIVKGMKMPGSCEWMDDKYNVHRCPILGDDDDCKLQDCKEDWTWQEQYAGCPLVELPEKHGRLIDERVAYDKIAEQEGGYYMDMDGVDMGLQETPTIIEAEGGEDDG